MRISDWSSDVCSSDLTDADGEPFAVELAGAVDEAVACHQVPADVYAVQQPELDGGPIGDLPVAVDHCADGIDGERVARTGDGIRSEERRVGKECVRTCRSRWSP